MNLVKFCNEKLNNATETVNKILSEDGSLKELEQREAWDYAKRTKTFMPIPDIKLAEYYSRNESCYKESTRRFGIHG